MTDKIIAIGDIHGQKSWENIAARHNDSTIVFLGDYCDPYDSEINEDDIIANLENIISFKKHHQENVILLLGNHDLHYFEEKAKRGSRFNHNICVELMMLFKSNRELFQYAWQYNDILFTHAGISTKWFLQEFKGNLSENIERQIENPLKYGNNPDTLFSCGAARNGNNLYGGIFWADYKETMKDYIPGIIQVVGHNRVREIFLKRKDTDSESKDGIIYCDCLAFGNYLMIDCTKKEDKRFYVLSTRRSPEMISDIRII